MRTFNRVDFSKAAEAFKPMVDAFDNAVAEWRKAADKAMEEATILHLGRRPSPEEIAATGRLVSYYDGTLEYYWGDQKLLTLRKPWIKDERDHVFLFRSPL